MPITIDGTGTISGLSAGGLPDASVITADIAADIAAGAVTQAKRSEDLTLGTAQNSTSGTSIDFTGIPSWAKRITVALAGVSTSGTNHLLVQIGTGGTPTTTGYVSTSNNYNQANGTAGVSSTAGFAVNQSASAASVTSGQVTITNVTGNLWISTHAVKNSTLQVATGGGDVTLAGVLNMVRITTIGGTDTFDAGSINILYE